MDDRTIIKHILESGNSAGYKLIVAKYSGLLFAKAIDVLKDENITKDVVQQAFIRAYSQLSSWSGSSLGPWLTAIAVHLSLHELEKMRRQVTQPLYGHEADATVEDYNEEHEALLQRMEAAIGKLPEKDKRIIQLHYYRGMKTKDIAQVLNMSIGNVLIKLHRIREQLKKDIQNEDNE
ncbi:MAG: RNA polymerase sigma factor [Prevotellaceae bacterium]|nr:RNA polymerase sigma factor [Prevotellaceae bacterium]MDY3856100.1 RNA polymerase sigma factor [Bacteroidaceae bacterium]